jgi:hypothetical protein
MSFYRILAADRARNTVSGNPMFDLLLAEVVGGVEQTPFNCRNKPNSGFIYGLQVHGLIQGTVETTKGGRVYLTDAHNVPEERNDVL